jgi:hypothetical protein
MTRREVLKALYEAGEAWAEDGDHAATSCEFCQLFDNYCDECSCYQEFGRTCITAHDITDGWDVPLMLTMIAMLIALLESP